MADEVKSILADAVRDSVWKPESVTKEPRTLLSCWRVFEVTFLDGTISIHFAGYTGTEGRVSSPIQNYSHVLKVGVSRSGREYELCGPPGWHADASWTWEQWVRMNKCSFLEVTKEYV